MPSSAREFASVAPDAIRPLPEEIGGLSGRYLRGVAHQGDRLLLVVDVPELLAHDVTPIDAAPDAAPDAVPNDSPDASAPATP